MTAFGIVQFERPHVGPATDPAYIFMAMYLPFGITVAAAVTGFVSDGSIFCGGALPASTADVLSICSTLRQQKEKQWRLH